MPSLVGPLIEDLDSSLSFSATKRKASKIAQGKPWTGMSSLEEAKFDVSKCADGRVCFTHFVYISSETRMMSKDTLKKAFCRSAAIVFDEGLQGVDIVIPVFLAEDEYIGLLFQIKNRTSLDLEVKNKFDVCLTSLLLLNSIRFLDVLGWASLVHWGKRSWKCSC